jgi:hypothetical protein
MCDLLQQPLAVGDYVVYACGPTILALGIVTKINKKMLSLKSRAGRRLTKYPNAVLKVTREQVFWSTLSS